MILLLLAMQASSSTSCYPVFNQVHCDTYSQQATPVQTEPTMVPDYAGMLGLRNQPAPAAASDDGGAANRRAAAYNQVGELIAKGDCDGAKRLARFYNKPDIIKDAARACP